MGLVASCFLVAKQLHFVVWDICPLLGHVRDRNFVRLTVHIWAGCALYTDMGQDAQSSGAARAAGWRKGHLFLIGPSSSSGSRGIFPNHTETLNMLAGPYSICSASISKAYNGWMLTVKITSEKMVRRWPHLDTHGLSPKVLTSHQVIPQGASD